MKTKIDYTAKADLFLGSTTQNAVAAGSRHFNTAASAIRFAVEHAAPISMRGASLVTNGRTLAGIQILALYESGGYPLTRSTSATRPIRH